MSMPVRIDVQAAGAHTEPAAGHESAKHGAFGNILGREMRGTPGRGGQDRSRSPAQGRHGQHGHESPHAKVPSTAGDTTKQAAGQAIPSLDVPLEQIESSARQSARRNAHLARGNGNPDEAARAASAKHGQSAVAPSSNGRGSAGTSVTRTAPFPAVPEASAESTSRDTPAAAHPQPSPGEDQSKESPIGPHARLARGRERAATPPNATEEGTKTPGVAVEHEDGPGAHAAAPQDGIRDTLLMWDQAANGDRPRSADGSDPESLRKSNQSPLHADGSVPKTAAARAHESTRAKERSVSKEAQDSHPDKAAPADPSMPQGPEVTASGPHTANAATANPLAQHPVPVEQAPGAPTGETSTTTESAPAAAPERKPARARSADSEDEVQRPHGNDPHPDLEAAILATLSPRSTPAPVASPAANAAAPAARAPASQHDVRPNVVSAPAPSSTDAPRRELETQREHKHGDTSSPLPATRSEGSAAAPVFTQTPSTSAPQARGDIPPPPLPVEATPLVNRVAEDPGLSMAVMPQAARLAIQSPDGDLELRLRVRDGSADISMTGSMAPLFDNRAPEVRAALASEGLGLGHYNLNQQNAGQQGNAWQGQGQQGQWQPPPERHQAPASGPTPATAQGMPRATASSEPHAVAPGHIHVTA